MCQASPGESGRKDQGVVGCCFTGACHSYSGGGGTAPQVGPQTCSQSSYPDFHRGNSITPDESQKQRTVVEPTPRQQHLGEGQGSLPFPRTVRCLPDPLPHPQLHIHTVAGSRRAMASKLKLCTGTKALSKTTRWISPKGVRAGESSLGKPLHFSELDVFLQNTNNVNSSF